MQGSGGRLAGKTALITGAASGIGCAAAVSFHAEGAKVAATDRNEAGLAGAKAFADLMLLQDVTDEARWREVVDSVVAAFGRLDILVNSAGIAFKGNIETATLDEWRKTQAVNVEGTFLGCREAIRAMKQTGGGSIVNLSLSRASSAMRNRRLIARARGCEAAYQVRGAVLRRRHYNIRMNSVHPSFADTPMVQQLIASSKNPDRVREGLARAAPMGRPGRAEEVAARAVSERIESTGDSRIG
jgi:3(or 17)beta-hydroxysteroid dehydrogenase